MEYPHPRLHAQWFKRAPLALVAIIGLAIFPNSFTANAKPNTGVTVARDAAAVEEVKTERKKFLFFSRKESAPEAAKDGPKKPRRRLFQKREKPVVVSAEANVKTKAEPAERRRLIDHLPFIGGGNKSDAKGDDEKSGAIAELPGRDEVVVSKVEKKRLNEVAPAPAESKGGAEQKKGLFGLFGGKEKGDAVAETGSRTDVGVGQKYVITAAETPFFTLSPIQPFPPDEILSKGTVVTVRKLGWGWSDIELPGGQMGMVDSKLLRKATARDLGGSYASRRSGGSRSVWRVFHKAPEPELPSDAGGIPLGLGLLPPLDADE